MHGCQPFMEVARLIKLWVDLILAGLVDEANLISQLDICKSLDKGSCVIELVRNH